MKLKLGYKKNNRAKIPSSYDKYEAKRTPKATKQSLHNFALKKNIVNLKQKLPDSRHKIRNYIMKIRKTSVG